MSPKKSMSRRSTFYLKDSLTNYLAASERFIEEENLDDEEEASSTSSDLSTEKHSRTFENVKEISGAWGTHRFDGRPWMDCYRPYVKLDEEEESVIPEDYEEEDLHGVLTDSLIGSCLSYLERSPEDLHYVLCKCVLSRKRLHDISEIKYYHYIQYLDISWNELTTLAPLGQLPFLQHLDVSHNHLAVLLDFKASFYLTFVNFSYNFVSTIPDLTQFWSITHLDLSNNKIEKISGLENLRYLSYLDLSYNEIEKLENLNNLRIQFLILHHNAIENSEDDNLVEFKTLSCIRSVDLSHNSFSSLKLFHHTENVESINMSSNNISTLMEIYYLNNIRFLSRLDLRDNPVCDLKYYINVCLTTMKNLMMLDGESTTAEQRIEVKRNSEVDPSFPARESRLELILLQQINRPYIGPHIVPYDQPPPMIIMLVGPPGSKKKEIVKLFCDTNEKLAFGISHTTRPKVENEVDGEDYYFVSNDEFKTINRKGQFITMSEFNGYSYGIAHEELRKCLEQVLVFHGDVNSGLSLRIMGIQPKLVLAMPRDENTHTKWLQLKYFYDSVQQGIIRIKNCPQCVKCAFSSQKISQDNLIKDIRNLLEHIIDKIVNLKENGNATSDFRRSLDTDPSVRFDISQDISRDVSQDNIDDISGTDSAKTASGILKRRGSTDKDEPKSNVVSFTEDTLTDYSFLREKMDSKRVSFNDLPDIDIADDQYAFDENHRSVSETVVSCLREFNKDKPIYLSALSQKEMSGIIAIEDVYKKKEFYDKQNQKLNDFVEKIIESRNELLELHWSNPGLFRETIFTDEVGESLQRLRNMLKFMVEHSEELKPTISFEKDEAYKSMVRSRIDKLDPRRTSDGKTDRNRTQCNC